ncbi:MAG: NAD(P)(+) transhydrogenase (Re/Si-specific) subunit alpha [Candidatus Sericytochromatia bacterium]|nr:NAD(P)(+) transhydrogenase (Re/Si-specific) subunit alpha [Candidatus Sericytochromatia bacterium]
MSGPLIYGFDVNLVISVLRPSAPESRVPLLPADVRKLTQMGLPLQLESGFGQRLGFADAAYAEAGARLSAERADLLRSAEVLLCLQPPPLAELVHLPAGRGLIALLDPFQNAALLQHCLDHQLQALALELIPRSSRAQAMDVLSSQASLAGYMAVMLAASHSPRVLPMMSTPAGTLQPARVFVLGAGVAGLQAIATARRLGARVEAGDLRPEAQEQIASLGARAVSLLPTTAAARIQTSQDGYLTALSGQTLTAQQALLQQICARTDLLITTAQVFGGPAPRLILPEMLAAMPSGAVVVDLAVETGGNVAGVVPDQICLYKGVQLIGYRNLPGRVPHAASQMLSANLTALLQALWEPDSQTLQLQPEHPIVPGALATAAGQIVAPALLQRRQ